MKGRWRSKTVAFRVSPEEDAQIERLVALSGLTKQDYIVKRLQNKDIIVIGNPRVHKALRNQLITVLKELQRIESGAQIDDDLMDMIRLINIRNTEKLSWDLEKAETELWKEAPEPLLEELTKKITADAPDWQGSPTELVAFLGIDLKPNILTMKLNVNAGRLFNEYGICYESSRSHDGRKVKFHLEQTKT